jgi:hypothetical protein|tara:strand:+ start:997 stop:1512 length:516 start_codon:yes stop_codon:yes gene_type:complete
MNHLKSFLILSWIFFVVGCEDGNENNSTDFAEVITSNVNEGDYLYNFSTAKQVANDSSSSWHMKYHNLDTGTGYKMPNISLNDNILLYIDTSSDFESITTAPSPSSFQPEGGRMQYGGKNTALSYDMTIHKVGVSSAIYLLYEIVTNRVFKVVFDDYDSGVIIFRFSELSN